MAAKGTACSSEEESPTFCSGTSRKPNAVHMTALQQDSLPGRRAVTCWVFTHTLRHLVHPPPTRVHADSHHGSHPGTGRAEPRKAAHPYALGKPALSPARPLALRRMTVFYFLPTSSWLELAEVYRLSVCLSLREAPSVRNPICINRRCTPRAHKNVWE